jgi:hypothetical protein
MLAVDKKSRFRFALLLSWQGRPLTFRSAGSSKLHSLLCTWQNAVFLKLHFSHWAFLFWKEADSSRVPGGIWALTSSNTCGWRYLWSVHSWTHLWLSMITCLHDGSSSLVGRCIPGSCILLFYYENEINQWTNKPMNISWILGDWVWTLCFLFTKNRKFAIQLRG